MNLPVQDPKSKPMKRRTIFFNEELWEGVQAFALSLQREFGRPVCDSEAVRLLCTAALSAEKSSEKAPKARGSKS